MTYQERLMNFKPFIVVLDEKVDKIVKQLYRCYNALASSAIETTPKHELLEIKKILQMLRDMHCAVLHNESTANALASARQYWVETHHDIFIRIRHHIADLDEKFPLDFQVIHSSLIELNEMCRDFVKTITECELKQQFHVRIALYRYHLKALSMHCAIQDTFFPFLGNHKTLETEGVRVQIVRRYLSLFESFKDAPHPLQLRTEVFPHDDFTKHL